MNKSTKFIIFSSTILISSILNNNSFAGRMIVASDMNITDADYSGNWGDNGIAVNSNNAGNPWIINLSGTLSAKNNVAGLYLNSSGNLEINAIGSNMVLDFSSNNQGGLGITNEGGKLTINGGSHGGSLIAGSTISSNYVMGYQNWNINSLTNINNMNISIENSRANGSYLAAIHNKGIMNISSTSANQWIVVKDNYAQQYMYAISTGMNDTPAAITNINGMNINISNNNIGNSGIKQLAGIATVGNINITGAADGSNVYIFNGNTSSDFLSAVSNWGSTKIENMNILMNNNTSDNLIHSFANFNGYYSLIKGVSSGINSILIKDNTATNGYFDGFYNAGNFDIENMNILIDNNNAGSYLYGIWATSTSTTNIKGVASGTNSFVIKNNTADNNSFLGFSNAGNMNIENMNIEISNNISNNNYAIGFYNSKTLNITGIASRNSMILKDNGTAGFWTSGSASVTTVKNMNIASSGNLFSILLSGATFTLDNSAAAISDNSNAFEFGNTGNKINITNGSSISTNGGSLMAVANTTEATMNVDNSYVSGKIETDTGATSTLNLTDSSTWKMKDNSKLSLLSSTNSIIDMRSSISGTYNTLTLNNYNANNSTIFLNTFLGGDNSPTDKIVIESGNAAGTTILNVISTGGNSDTTGDGIKIVDAQNGATIGTGSFILNGGKVDTGAYEYYMYQGDISGTDTQSMFLRTSGNLTDTSKNIANEPSSTIVMVRAGMNSLMKRMGELRNTNECDTSGVWARTYAKSTNVDDKIESKMNFYGFEAGVDTLVSELNSSNRVFAGVMAGYIYTDNIKTKKASGFGHANTPNVGAYLTVLSKKGWFIDGVIRHFWMDTDMNTHASNGQLVRYSVKRQATAFSLETGHKMVSNIDQDSRFIIEPKAEAGFAFSKAETTYTNLGDKLKYDDTNSYSIKTSLLLGYERKFDNGNVIEPYTQFAVIHEFDGKTEIHYSNASYYSNFGGTSFEIGGGINAKTSRHTSAYAEVMYEKGSTIESVSANLGFRYTF